MSGFARENSSDRRQRPFPDSRHAPHRILTGMGEVETRVPKDRNRTRSPGPCLLIARTIAGSAPCEPLDAATPWL